LNEYGGRPFPQLALRGQSTPPSYPRSSPEIDACLANQLTAPVHGVPASLTTGSVHFQIRPERSHHRGAGKNDDAPTNDAARRWPSGRDQGAAAERRSAAAASSDMRTTAIAAQWRVAPVMCPPQDPMLPNWLSRSASA